MKDDLLSSGNRLDLEALERLAIRPGLFAPHDDPFWSDPHISEQMLAAHLDPERDAASRRHETIDRTVNWLLSHLRLGPGQKVLDLGCGPGLYCERLARHGFRVVGIDFSTRSIAYARENARRLSLDVEYVCQDYTQFDREAEFDAIFLIYFDFGVLSNLDRDEVLRRIYRALNPGGVFVFDAITTDTATEADGTQTWSIAEGGFWKPGPYLDLTQFFNYPEDDAKVRQVIVVESNGRVSRYRIWEHWYTPETIATVLATTGFRVDSVWSDLAGQPYSTGSPSLGVVARRT